MLDDDLVKFIRGCLMLVVALVIQFLLSTLACWLVCKCGGWQFRWLYPITGYVLALLMKLTIRVGR